jgi:hypothetical protein
VGRKILLREAGVETESEKTTQFNVLWSFKNRLSLGALVCLKFFLITIVVDPNSFFSDSNPQIFFSDSDSYANIWTRIFFKWCLSLRSYVF